MRVFIVGLLVALAGCGMLTKATAPVPAPMPEAAAPVTMPELGTGTSVAVLDDTTQAEKAAALAPAAAGERSLGRAVVGLGSPAEQGFWLKSTLVTVAAKGRVVTDGGASVNVDLLPGTGGALLSLAAFRALGLGLTDLPEVAVYAN